MSRNPINPLLAAAVRVSLGINAEPPAPLGITSKPDEDELAFKIFAAKPGSEHEPAPGKFTKVGDVCYVREDEYDRVIESIRKSRAKKAYANKY